MKKCVFCQSRHAKTYEDAWPVWSTEAWKEKIPGVGFDNSLTRGSVVAPELLRQWKGRHRVGGFCSICNNGWMSRIEARVKPILMPLIFGESFSLTPKDQKTLARWAYLKALVFSLSTPEVEIAPAEFMRFYKKRTPPPTAPVLLLNSLDLFAGSLYRWETMDVTHLDGSKSVNHRVNFVLGHVVLQVFGPRPSSVPVLSPARIEEREFCARIWRPRQDTVRWPLERQLQREAVASLLDFFMKQRPA